MTMKNFVIAIRENDKSLEAASKCIASAAKFNLEVDYYDAFVPSEARDFIKEQKINDNLFNGDKSTKTESPVKTSDFAALHQLL